MEFFKKTKLKSKNHAKSNGSMRSSTSGFIKELFLEIGALIIIVLSTIGVIQNREEPLVQPPVITFEERQESEESSEEEADKAPISEIEEEPENPIVIPPPVETVETPVVIDSSPAPVDTSSDDLTGELTALNTNELTRKAIVNVFCVSNDARVNSITGSGIIIDPRGVVLTNAHIAQHMLLDELTDCTLRTGSPAENTYKVELLYISPDWIKDNFNQISQENPKGTGENDFALLRITGRTNPSATLPGTFSFVDLNLGSDVPAKNSDVLIVGYPAGFLGGNIIQSGLNIVSATGKVNDVFTFGNNNLDLFSVLGSIIAQKGASGGAVVDGGGKLIGIVVTASQEETTGARELRAITISHIERSLIENLGLSISSFLLGDISGKSAQFQSLIAPTLKALLLQAI